MNNINKKQGSESQNQTTNQWADRYSTYQYCIDPYWTEPPLIIEGQRLIGPKPGPYQAEHSAPSSSAYQEGLDHSSLDPISYRDYRSPRFVVSMVRYGLKRMVNDSI